jgi:hypothetical protein
MSTNPDSVTNPEDALVISEVLRRLLNIIGDLPMHADANVNQRDLYFALRDAHEQAQREAQR